MQSVFCMSGTYTDHLPNYSTVIETNLPIRFKITGGEWYLHKKHSLSKMKCIKMHDNNIESNIGCNTKLQL